MLTEMSSSPPMILLTIPAEMRLKKLRLCVSQHNFGLAVTGCMSADEMSKWELKNKW